MKMLTIEDLEGAVKAGCSNPNCDHKEHGTLFLNPVCHPQAGLEVAYAHGSGALRITCEECGQPIALVAVANFHESPPTT